MWIEDYRIANNLELDELAHRVNLVGQKMMRPPLEGTVTDTLIHILEISKVPRTHPRIADAIAIACNATQEQRDSIVDPRHHGTWEPILTKTDWHKNPAVIKTQPLIGKQGIERGVVMVDQKGHIVKRFKTVKSAALATGVSESYVQWRCKRNTRNEFDNGKEVTYRYSAEWDTMNQIQRLKDLGVDVGGD